MNDGIKTRLSVLLYASMFVLPVVSLASGWTVWDLRAGIVAALLTFATCFVLAGVLLATVRDISWVAVGLPFALGVIYAASPDFILGSFDDAAVLSAGALMTFGLWVRKQPDTPKWIVFPLLVSGLYTLVGDVIPGRVDELLVSAISAGGSGYAAWRRSQHAPELPAAEQHDFVAGELAAQEE